MLHPINKNLILGIGKDATESGSPFFAWYDGLKLELFDVSNPQAPRSVRSLKLGKRGTSSAVLHDYHALTLLPIDNGETVRLALPVELYDGTASESQPSDFPGHFPWVSSGAHLFEIRSPNDLSKVDLSMVGQLVTQQANGSTDYPSYDSYERALIHGNTVYFAEGASKVVSAFWPGTK